MSSASLPLLEYLQFGGKGGHVVGQRVQSLARAVDDGSVADALLRALIVDHALIGVSSAQLLRPLTPELVRVQLGESLSIVPLWFLTPGVRCFQCGPIAQVLRQPA